MYMTRVQLKRIPAPNIIHGVLSAALPDERNKENECLWRIDKLGDRQILIVVSTKRPDLGYIEKKIGIANDAKEDDGQPLINKTVEYETFLKKIENDQLWNFRLCANPVENKKQDPNDKRGKVYALRTITEQLDWLVKQGEKHGFIVKNCSVINDSWVVFNDVRIRAITFDGTLSVSDSDAMRLALSHGIGRGKAYGCGLLTIARVQT